RTWSSYTTASRYQSRPGDTTSSPSDDLEQMTRNGRRVEPHEVARPAPRIRHAREEVAHVERLVLPGYTQCREVERRPTRLDVHGIEADEAEHHVAAGRIALAPRDHLVVVDRVEPQCVVAL